MCARPLGEHQDYCGGSLRAFFKQFVQLEVCSGKVAFSRSRPPAVGWFPNCSL